MYQIQIFLPHPPSCQRDEKGLSEGKGGEEIEARVEDSRGSLWYFASYREDERGGGGGGGGRRLD